MAIFNSSDRRRGKSGWLVMAAGADGSAWADYGMQWDNSGRNGHYAAIRWSNA